MLDAIRRHSKGPVGKIIMTIAMGTLILSFGIWGIGDILRGRVDTAVAHVGRVAISADEYQRALQRQVETLRESLGPDFDMAKARALGIDRRVLDSIIRTTALDLGAEDLNLTVPDDTLAKEIREIPAFRGPLGNFDRQQFDAVLRQNGYTEERFVAGMRRDGTRDQLIQTVASAILAPAIMAEPLFLYLGEQRVAHYLIVPPDAAGEAPQPSAEELRVYYEDNKENYRAPEYRNFTYIELAPATLAATIQVSEEDLRKQYDAHRDDYGEAERRTLLQLVFDTEDKAHAARVEIDGGKSFADVAKSEGRTEEDLRLENKSRDDLTAPLGDEAADAAFKLGEGEVSEPAKGRFGWLLLKAESITPGHMQSFEEARDHIRDDLAKDQATGRVMELSNKVEDARASGVSLEDAAKAAGIEAVTVEAADAEGKDADSKPITGLAPDILHEAFNQDVNVDADMKPLADGGYFVVRVNRIVPPDIRPLESIKDKVTSDYLSVERAHRLEDLAKRLAERVRSGTSLATVATELGQAPLTSEPIQRGSANETFSRTAVEKLFAAKVGDVVWGPVGLGESMLLMELTDVRAPDPTRDEANYGTLRDELAKALANDSQLAFSDALQEQFEVRINDRALEQLSGEQ
jgi:peptidyl-prolyl cis-trans isomerase D